MNQAVTIQTAEYEEIVKRLDKIANLQKQLLFAFKMRDPRTLPLKTKPEDEKK